MEIENLKSKCFDLIRQREYLSAQIQKLNQSIQNLSQEINKQEQEKENKGKVYGKSPVKTMQEEKNKK